MVAKPSNAHLNVLKYITNVVCFLHVVATHVANLGDVRYKGLIQRHITKPLCKDRFAKPITSTLVYLVHISLTVI